MGWRFRTSFKIIPGLRLNLSRSGLSASIGGAPFTVNVGPRGVYGTGSIPGTGIQLRQRLTDDSRQGERPDEFADLPTPPQIGSGVSSLREIRSASTERLTSDSLKE